MAFLYAVIFVLIVAVVSVVTRDIQVRSCCAVADPRQDLRLRAAFTDEHHDARST